MELFATENHHTISQQIHNSLFDYHSKVSDLKKKCSSASRKSGADVLAISAYEKDYDCSSWIVWIPEDWMCICDVHCMMYRL